MLTDDVAWDVWEDNFAQRAGVAHLAERHGPAEVAGFFEIVGSWTLRDFQVLATIGEGPQVCAAVRVDFERSDGGRIVDEEIHLWTVDEAGRLTAFRHYCDTAKHIAADRGEDTSVPEGR